MAKVIVLPHAEHCPDGRVLEPRPGQSVCELLLQHHIEIDHACNMNCACTTCHVLVREGLDALAPVDSLEQTITQGVPCIGPQSRLSCQLQLGEQDIVIEIP